MTNEKKPTFTLYKIYSENCLLYLGRTKQPLQTRLHGHFFKKPMHREINIDCVTKIEYANFPTEADMYLYEIYEINRLKPPLNRDDKAHDELTVDLPEPEWLEYECKLMDKWREQIRIADEADEEKRRLRRQIDEEYRAKRREIMRRDDLTEDQKLDLIDEWIEKYYEPARNGLL